MRSDSSFGPKFSAEQGVFALLLLLGLYFPTSTNGEHSGLLVLLAFAVLLGLLAYLLVKRGNRRGSAASIALPLMIVLSICTFCALFNGPFQFDWGVFTKFTALAMILALDLRSAILSRVARGAFVVANLINIVLGIGVLVGNEWVGQFLPTYYWSFYPELMPSMMTWHKPVLSFGTHASAGFFLYLFFWINWEAYKKRSSRLSLVLTIGNLVLLVGLASFTSLALGAVAVTQIGVWYWQRNRRLFVGVAISAVLMISAAAILFASEIEVLRSIPQLTEGVFLNSDLNGPLGRFGPGGTSRKTVSYVIQHPLSPIGFAIPSEAAGSGAALGDSGILENLLRGSVPGLVLIYFGLYQFLRFNLLSRRHALTLFLVIVTFEAGFSTLIYIRALYLLPFFVVYLNDVTADHPVSSSAPECRDN
jgi:hypothetical protein